MKDAAAFVRYPMKANHIESFKLCIIFHFDKASFARCAADNGALVVSQRELFSAEIYPRVFLQYSHAVGLANAPLASDRGNNQAEEKVLGGLLNLSKFGFF